MAQRHRFSRSRNKPRAGARRETIPSAPRVPFERRAPTHYGKAFVLLEDSAKNTFEFTAGAWIPYGLTIAQCRHDCLVNELPQKVNGNTRYEIRLPIAAEPQD
jgi:hypothetical protein